MAESVALGPDAASVRFHDALADREAEAIAVLALAPGSAVDPGELAEQPRHLLGGYTCALICDRDRYVQILRGRGHRDRGPLP